MKSGSTGPFRTANPVVSSLRRAWCAVASLDVELPISGGASPQHLGRLSPDSARTISSLEMRWHTFSHQAAALACADATASSELDGEPCVWAAEVDAQGLRSYIVASREAFWQRYRTMPPPARNYYEVIRAGHACHLYLDLEFCRRTNPRSDGGAMVRTLCTEVQSALAAQYGPGLDCQTVDLDSSTPTKFSRHVIVRMKDAAFADSTSCGRFVHALCSKLADRRRFEPRVANLFVNPPASEASEPAGSTPSQVCFVDLSVCASLAFGPTTLGTAQPRCTAAALSECLPRADGISVLRTHRLSELMLTHLLACLLAHSLIDPTHPQTLAIDASGCTSRARRARTCSYCLSA